MSGGRHTLRLDGTAKARVDPAGVRVVREAVSALWPRVFRDGASGR
ncbi:hypothetical protein BURKHO8Y_140237 [Burkholderia sp. 8Y]|nr:hypothetical protein [Burkholderia sp. 8Y]VXB54361.1 hypothetical protein BURKHO8Y_140237 [Burkholderia sp. 8Y]